MKRYDAIVVGSGAGGGVAACLLAEAGRSVLVIERGEWVRDEPRDHLRNHRLAQHGHNVGPALDDRRVIVHPSGQEQVVSPLEGGYNNNAMGVGGGTSVYGAQAWRFHPLDFKMASTYGVPDGSSLADWPITYEELAPYYEKVEWELGVAGTDPAPQMPARREYPMPRVQPGFRNAKFKEAADRLGWETQAVPLAVNSVPYNGRPACTQCQHCVGFACPVDAKNGSSNTFLARALATGKCELLVNTQVTAVLASEKQAYGVRCVGQEGEQEFHADLIVVAGSAIETARLLLASRSALHPKGLGNDHDQVGRNLQGHAYVVAAGIFEELMTDLVGPGPSISTLEFNHGNEGVIGGGMLADDFVLLPIIYAKRVLPPGAPRWGQAWKDFVREHYRRTAQIMGPVHEIPSAECRVTLDSRTDANGVPLARLSGAIHDETIRTHGFLRTKALDWLREAGAGQVWAGNAGKYLSGGQHQAGTCRMGLDPETSVVDPFGRVHGIQGLVVADGSVHVTNGGFNPFLTIMATSYRSIAEGVLGSDNV